MNQDNDRGEFTTPREDQRRLPNRQPRQPTSKERAQAVRSAGMRDKPLPPDVRPGAWLGK
jgi:hypothetical protein